MVGPLYLNRGLSFNDLKKIATDSIVDLKTYDLNAGRQSEPVELIHVFAKNLKNNGDQDSVDTNRELIARLREAYNNYEQELKKIHENN